MKRAWIAGLLAAALVSPAALADGEDDDENFWASLIAPNAKEIKVILGHARTLRAQALQFSVGYDTGYATSYEATQTENRVKRLEDAFGMLRYARRELDPSQPDVLFELGRAADDIERYDDALDALAEFLDVAEPDDIRRSEAHVRIGRIHARRGELAAAIESFRSSLLGKSSLIRSQALTYLGCAYMQVGKLDKAIDVLAQVANKQSLSYDYSQRAAEFALAVAYDRDEQITRSHEVLEKLISLDQNLTYVLGYRSSPYTGSALDAEPLPVPPLERHYFVALRYEALDWLEDARTEWLAYANAADDGPYRDRALAHIEAIDALQDERMKEEPKKKKPRPARHRLRPRRHP